MKVAASCAPPCGVLVEGEFDSTSREFIHRFLLPVGSSSKVRTAATEIEGVQLATFAPDSKGWFVTCPLCGRSIALDLAKDVGT